MKREKIYFDYSPYCDDEPLPLVGGRGGRGGNGGCPRPGCSPWGPPGGGGISGPPMPPLFAMKFRA